MAKLELVAFSRKPFIGFGSHDSTDSLLAVVITVPPQGMVAVSCNFTYL